MIKVAFFSFADIDNFGDILFSHIFKMEMEKRDENIKIDYFTPTEFSVEGLNYISYKKEKVIGKYDALVLFGGEVIHLYDQRTWIPIYEKNNQKLESALPSDVVFNWVDIESAFKAWISVGVRPVGAEQEFEKIKYALNNLDYISTRGNLSKKILENLEIEYNNPKIEITPDLGWLFPDLLRYKKCKGVLFKKIVNQENYLVFQINNITQEEAKKIAGYLLDFQKLTGMEVILLPVIRPWEDDKYLSMIRQFSGDKLILLPNNLTILEIADILIHSEIVLASSLHAAITALSEGIPAGVINKWQGSKLQDLFGHQYRLHMVKHQIEDIPLLLHQLLEEKTEGTDSLKLYAQFNKKRLRKVFDNLLGSVKKKKNNE